MLWQSRSRLPSRRYAQQVLPGRTLTLKLSFATRLHVLAARYARAVLELLIIAPRRERGMPGARCTRGPVCNRHEKMRTRAYRFSGEHPASPTQWLYGLCRDLLGDEFVFVTVAAGLRPKRSGWIGFRHRQLGISNGCRNHTVLPYATTSFVCAPRIAHGKPPCDHLARRRCRVHRISTRVRDDGQRPSCRVRRAEL
jgi:hypothetical protein